MQLLVVEDDEDHAMLVRRALEREDDWTVEHASTVGEARSKIVSNAYDMVILDYRLPDGDGIDLLEQVGKQTDAPPVLFLTGEGDEEVAMQAMRRGAVDYLVKGPSMGERVHDRVKEVVAGWSHLGPLVTLEGGAKPSQGAADQLLTAQERKAVATVLDDVVDGPVLGAVVVGPGGDLIAAQVPKTIDAERFANRLHAIHGDIMALGDAEQLDPRRYTLVSQSSEYLIGVSVAPGPLIIALVMRRKTSELIGLRRVQEAARKVWEAT